MKRRDPFQDRAVESSLVRPSRLPGVGLLLLFAEAFDAQLHGLAGHRAQCHRSAPFHALDEAGERQGVVHLITRDENNPETWAQTAWIKAPNPGDGDAFGNSVALSGTGRVLAVGAPEEDGAATGVDGNREDDSAQDAGAVYLY